MILVKHHTIYGCKGCFETGTIHAAVQKVHWILAFLPKLSQPGCVCWRRLRWLCAPYPMSLTSLGLTQVLMQQMRSYVGQHCHHLLQVAYVCLLGRNVEYLQWCSRKCCGVQADGCYIINDSLRKVASWVARNIICGMMSDTGNMVPFTICIWGSFPLSSWDMCWSCPAVTLHQISSKEACGLLQWLGLYSRGQSIWPCPQHQRQQGLHLPLAHNEIQPGAQII